MKKLKLALSAFILLASFVTSQAQVRLESGDLAPLKGVTKVNIVYDYSKMAVGGYATEQEYINKKMDDYKKEPEKQTKWKDGWFGARKARYEPKFEELFNSVGSKTGIMGVNNATDGPVTLKVETTFTEPGFNAGVVRKSASLDFKCTFSKDGKDFATYTIRNVPGGTAMGYDFDAGSRIAESYAKAAKMLMKDVNKRLKKIK
ncbi:hypothetical protein CNR22_05110 [Sphingobacteriaceae bacterium]|nr:hypothetical protein CNR22_05110 [Sphingobacteriaceae bacterium]